MMNKIVLSSNNKKKIAEMETLFRDHTSNEMKLYSLRDIGFLGDIVEDGDSFEENSIIKAMVPASMGHIGIADDSGLVVDALCGAPGIYSARYSGENATDQSNRDKLLLDMEKIPIPERTARFICTASVVFPENSGYIVPEKWRIPEELSKKRGIPRERVMVVRGECHGTILFEEHGDGGFGYDSLFYYPQFDATFAEVPQEKKNEISHRGIAMREFVGRLVEILTENERR